MVSRLFTIPPDRPFLDTLAAGLLRKAGGDPLLLPRFTVLLPTRRAVRSLREAFLRAAPDGRKAGAPLLLPRMRPIGDIDSDELSLADGETLEVPPAIPELRRRLLLTRLVLRWGRVRGSAPLLPGQAAALAAGLARFLDTVESEEAPLARLRDLAPADLAEHWQIVHRFLEILPQHWPSILAAEGAIDPAERRNRLLRRQATLWRRSPPQDPVIAAGLTGGIPALSELIDTVAGLPRGAVIFAGLDRSHDETEWQQIVQDESHPQHLFARLLADLELGPDDVRDWPEDAIAAPSARAARTRLIAEALRPAAVTDAWRALDPVSADALASLTRYDCINAQHEAMTAALILRRKLDEPGATAALVTPDRELARRVAAELHRWQIEIDDSAGIPLNRTPPGTFLRLILDLADSRLAPVPLLAALKHPLAAGGMARAEFRDYVRRLEHRIRGPRPAPGFPGLRSALGAKDRTLRRFVDRLEACLGPLPALLAGDAVPLDRLAEAHIGAAERLAATDDEGGDARLWHEAAGERAAHFCHELIEVARDFPPLAGRHYPAVFESLAAAAVVRPTYGRHPRVFIWGLVEARLQQADLIVLGGLNEGSWPGPAAHDPWMSRQMRRDFGIAVPERAIGIAAHDFAQALGAPEAALTRAARQEGAPTVPSRWLLRLDAVLRAVRLPDGIGPDPVIEAAAERLDEAGRYRPLPPAEPRPPLAARPRRLSVTEIETWLRDPYAIYARRILRLDALDELDADPGRAELGSVIHKALEKFVRRFPTRLPADPEVELLAIGLDCFGPLLSRPGAWAFWWPRFERIAHWLVAEEATRRPGIAESLSECDGSLEIAAPGGPFTLTARADRIDRLTAGGFLIADFKTGAVPSAKQVRAGFAPQLPLEGAILREGGFGAMGSGSAELEYWRLSGGNPAGERKPLGKNDPVALIVDALARLEKLVAHFDDAATPYLAVPAPPWAPRFSDYRHLERIDEGGAEE